jgi:hypothetical protein
MSKRFGPLDKEELGAGEGDTVRQKFESLQCLIPTIPGAPFRGFSIVGECALSPPFMGQLSVASV